ncbi:hypothetical protein AVEN_67285-1 [Araneus ventricosus]|uniref:Uncharacterized protein n=1 Tax=Araneus ventricosus TaxID=182803 RepID=A0A4Y2I6F8_ARAVE|nr:hypothetical protein AVEN_67285-1 [Araneus ventricosus]
MKTKEKSVKFRHKTRVRWQICCITFDDDDVIEPPYGENPAMDSEEEYINRMIPEKEMMKNVLDWINGCDFEKYDSFVDRSSDESTYYPSVATCTDTSEAKANDSEARELCKQMEEINNDLKVLSRKLDEIAVLQKLL